MNLENMQKLVDWLGSTKNPVEFNMGNWFTHNQAIFSSPSTILGIIESHPCGTSACIAGHAAILAWDDGVEQKNDKHIQDVATDWLGLTFNSAFNLFYGHWPAVDALAFDEIKIRHVIMELKRLISLETFARGQRDAAHYKRFKETYHGHD